MNIDQTQLTFICLVVSDTYKPVGDVFSVKLDPSSLIDELKARIIEKHYLLNQKNTASILLWKPNDGFKLATTPFERLDSSLQQLRLDRQSHQEENGKMLYLDPGSSVGDLFVDQSPKQCIHVLVQLPANMSPESSELDPNPRAPKRRRMDVSPPAGGSSHDIPFHISYYAGFWGVPLGSVFTTLPTHANTELDETGEVAPRELFLDLKPRLFVREEYIRVFDAIKILHEKSGDTRLAVVTGQPGIGKTFWIAYALRRCLGEKQPVVWYRDQICYLFSELGVKVVSPGSYNARGSHTWCFVDSVDAPTTLPPSICRREIQLFPIYVTSPEESRWRKLHQQRIPTLVVMNPWTIEEIMTAELILQWTALSQEDIRDFYQRRTSLISSTTTAELLATLINDSQLLRMGDVSNSICVVHRPDLDAMGTYVVDPITPAVRYQLREQLLQLEQKEFTDLMKRFSRVPPAHGMTGVLFEAQLQRIFSGQIKLVAKPMFRTLDLRSRWPTFGDFSSNPRLQRALSDAPRDEIPHPNEGFLKNHGIIPYTAQINTGHDLAILPS